MLCVPQDKILACCKAAVELNALTVTVPGHDDHDHNHDGGHNDDDDDDEDPPETLEADERLRTNLRRRSELALELDSMMVWLTHLPLCLGAGATQLAVKVRLILHNLWMLSTEPRLQSLAEFVGNVVSFTTDLGTEAGIADFQAPSIRSTLPAWMFPDAHGHGFRAPDDEVEEGFTDPHRPSNADVDADHPQGDRYVFPRALVIGGVIHVCHNLSWKMDQAMSYFDRWLAGLKSIVTLLHDDSTENCISTAA